MVYGRVYRLWVDHRPGAAIPEDDRKRPAALAINIAHDAFAIRRMAGPREIYLKPAFGDDVATRTRVFLGRSRRGDIAASDGGVDFS